MAFICLPEVFENHDCRGKQGGNRPPQAKSKFENQSRSAGALANPFDGLPDIRRGGNAETPRHGADDPEEATLGLAFAHFLGAELHAELSASGESAREGNGHATQDAQSGGRLLRGLSAGWALAQMRG